VTFDAAHRMSFAQRWVTAAPWGELNSTRAILESCNAFMDPAEADDRRVRLRLPDPYA
jgi:hypothetical protein